MAVTTRLQAIRRFAEPERLEPRYLLADVAAAVRVLPTSDLITSESGGTANFSVLLSRRPSDEVTIRLRSSDPGEGTTSVDSLRFLPETWSVPQTVIVTGRDDPEVDANVPYTVELLPATSVDAAFNEIDPSDVSITNIDNDGLAGGAGRIYVVERDGDGSAAGGQIGVFDFAGNRVATIDHLDFNQGVISDVELDPGGDLWVSLDLATLNDVETTAGRLLEFAPDGNRLGTIEVTTDLPGSFVTPAGFDISEDGTFWVTQPNVGAVLQYSAQGQLVSFQSPGPGVLDVAVTGLQQFPSKAPQGFINLRGDGNLWVAEPAQNRAVLIDQARNELRLQRTGDGPFDAEEAADGSLFVTNAGARSLQRFGAGGELLFETGVSGVPIGLAVAPGVSPPSVAIAAADPVASEEGPDPALLVISRTGDLTEPLAVAITLEGTAAHGVDYLPRPGLVTIPAGASSAEVTIVPVADHFREENETVIATIIAQPTYTLKPSSSAHVTITNVDPVTSSLDVDGNGRAEPLKDGILISRFLFGATGTHLTAGAVGTGAVRGEAAEIETFLASASTMLDVDDNGVAEPLKDGILISRFLFGAEGTNLTAGVQAENAQRTDPVEIAEFLAGFLPAGQALAASSSPHPVEPNYGDAVVAEDPRRGPPNEMDVADVQYGPMANAGGHLIDLYLAYREHQSQLTRVELPIKPYLQLRDEAVGVTVRLRSEFAEAVEAISSMGMAITRVSPQYEVLEGYFPIAGLLDLARREDVVSIAPLFRSLPQLPDSEQTLASQQRLAGGARAGSAENQADRVFETDFARAAYGIDGSGTMVGVISDSVDRAAGGLDDSVASGDLPDGVRILQDNSPVAIDEGRAMLELIHDIAPGAELAFHTGFDALLSQLTMVDAIQDLVAAGADVVVDDLGIVHEPMFQEGVIAQAIEAAVGEGVTVFSSVGNGGDNGFELPAGFFINSLGIPVIDFDPNPFISDPFMDIEVTEVDGLLEFQWDNPFNGVVGNVSANLDIFFFDPRSGQLVASGTDNNLATGRPTEVVMLPRTGTYQVGIQLSGLAPNAERPTRFKFASRKGFGIGSTEHPGIRASTFGHNAGQFTIAVGAVPFHAAPPYSSQQPIRSEEFSSAGPVNHLFDKEGRRLRTPLHLQRPQISGVDLTNTSFFGADIPEDPDTHPNFPGTSAAAPNVAAIAALIKEFAPSATPIDIFNALVTTAQPLNGADVGQWDPQGGLGLVNGLRAIAAFDEIPPSVVIDAVDADPRTTPVEAVQVVFSEPVFNFQLDDLVLTRDGGPNLLTGAQSVSSGSLSRQFTIQNLAAITAEPGNYRLTLVSFGSGIVDLAGNSLSADAALEWRTTTVTEPGITLSETDGATLVAEGGEIDTYAIVLDSLPSAAVTLTVTPDAQLDVGAGPGRPATIIIEPSSGHSPVLIEVAAVDDLSVEGPHTGLISHAVSSSDPNYDQRPVRDLLVQIEDNDQVRLTLDVDDNGRAEPLKDGILISRFLFGATATNLTAGAIGTGARRGEAAEIVTYLNSAASMLDVDLNGAAEPLKDGILISRYLFGATGDDLTAGAIGDGALRTEATEITAYLSGFLPAGQAGIALGAAPPINIATDRRQLVTALPATRETSVGGAIRLAVNYTTAPLEPRLTGLGLRLHYNSSRVRFDELSEPLATNVAVFGQVNADVDDGDGDPSTDRYVLVAWADATAPPLGPNWPGNLPAQLYDAHFTALAAGDARFNFTAQDTAAGYEFSGSGATASIMAEDNEDPRQLVTALPATQEAAVGGAIRLAVNYTTAPLEPRLTGLGLRLHYNSSRVRFDELSEPLATNVAVFGQVNADVDDGDGDPSTDRYVLVAWADATAPPLGPNWPGNLPAQLYVAHFTALAAGDARFNFTAQDTAAGYEFSGSGATASIVPGDGEPPLAVSSLTANRNGFIVDFTAPLQRESLNVFGNDTGTPGPPDVQLEDPSGRSVAGSLLLDESRESVRFVATRGVLGPGSYVVRLRSGPDGFLDLDGRQLDGNGDGQPGDDYFHEFTILPPATDAVTLSIPNFVRGPGQAVDVPPVNASGIPVSIDRGEGVRAIDFRLSYDAKLLEIRGAEVSGEAPSGSSVVLNNLTPGVVIVTFFSPSALPAGPLTFLHLRADIPAENAAAIHNQTGFLDIHSIRVLDSEGEELPALDDDAIQVASYFADVSGNGGINASDASRVARFAALLEPGFATFPLLDPALLGDVSGNGTVNAIDASKIAQHAALISVPEIPPIPARLLQRGVAFAPVGGSVGETFWQVTTQAVTAQAVTAQAVTAQAVTAQAVTGKPKTGLMMRHEGREGGVLDFPELVDWHLFPHEERTAELSASPRDAIFAGLSRRFAEEFTQYLGVEGLVSSDSDLEGDGNGRNGDKQPNE